MNQRNAEISKGVDWLLVWLYIILVCIGILSIFAATYKEGDDVLKSFLSVKTDYSRQALFFIISGIFATFILLTDSKFFSDCEFVVCSRNCINAIGLSFSQ